MDIEISIDENLDHAMVTYQGCPAGDSRYTWYVTLASSATGLTHRQAAGSNMTLRGAKRASRRAARKLYKVQLSEQGNPVYTERISNL